MNTNCDNKFYDVTISDLIPLILKQWRKIFLIGIMIAVAFGLFKLIPIYIAADNFEKNPASVTKYEEEKKLLQGSIKKTQSEIEFKENELKESIYYNLEPTMITRGFISFYIDTPMIDKDFGYQQNLVNFYVSYFESGEICNNIATQLDEYIKPEYLTQLVKTKTDYANGLSSFNIYVMGSNRDQTYEIMQLIKQAVYDKKDDVSSILTEHTISMISEDITVVSDAKVKKDQLFQSEGLEALKSKLNDKKSLLQNIESTYVTKKDALLSGLIFGLIGLIFGMVLSMVYYAVVVIFSSKIKTRNQIESNYGVDVLGEFVQKHKKFNKLDALISNLSKEPYDFTKEETNRIIANNMIAMSKSKKILIVGCKDIPNVNQICDGISSCKILMDYELSFIDKPLSNSETLATMLNCGSVIIIAKKNKTTLEELQNAIHIVDNYKKDFVGVILA
jgi:hypothetical protein